MKSKYLKSKETESWALPGSPISLDELKDGVKKAEKGPFYPIRESKKYWKNGGRKETPGKGFCII